MPDDENDGKRENKSISISAELKAIVEFQDFLLITQLQMNI